MGKLKLNSVAIVAMLYPAVASAEDQTAPTTQTTCELYQVESLDLNIEPEGDVTIPITVDGVSGEAIVDTGNVTSEVTDDVAFTTKASVFQTPASIELMGGIRSNQYILPKTIAMGKIAAHSFYTYLFSADQMSSNQIGMIGPNILANYDIDFDYAHGKLNVFSQDHCPGRVVYWTSDKFAVVPFEIDSDGHILIKVVLDGKPITAVVDTGATGSVVTIGSAEEVLGIKSDDPKMKSTGAFSINGAKATQSYRYPFSSLTFEGVAVSNPDILIVKDDGFRRSPNQLLLGASVLRQLHLYVAYKEKNLYITGAEAPPVVPHPVNNPVSSAAQAH
jgi:predicted aspartyl protease